MSELFQRNKSTISRHIKNILEGSKLLCNSVIAENATTAGDGRNRSVAFFATVQNEGYNSTCAESAQVQKE